MILHLPYIIFFFTCIHFPLCLQEYQSREKCIRVNLTLFCKSGKLKPSLEFLEIFIRVDLIHGFRLEFAEKTWHVKNLIYSITVIYLKSYLYCFIATNVLSFRLKLEILRPLFAKIVRILIHWQCMATFYKLSFKKYPNKSKRYWSKEY